MAKNSAVMVVISKCVVESEFSCFNGTPYLEQSASELSNFYKFPVLVHDLFSSALSH